jgi:hypothetical protein
LPIDVLWEDVELYVSLRLAQWTRKPPGASAQTPKISQIAATEVTTLFPRRRCGKVAPAGQSRHVKALPLANVASAVGMLVSDGYRCSTLRRGSGSCQMV